MLIAEGTVRNPTAGGIRADEAAALVPKNGWQRLSCADGSKGPRLYDWALIGTAESPGYHLLVRRSLVRERKARSSWRSSAAGRLVPCSYRR